MFPYLKVFGIQIPMYGLLMAFAMLTSVFLSWLRARKRGQDGDKLLTIAIAAIICGILGAKLLYIAVTYKWHELVEAVRANGILWLLEGGIVFYGGLIGGILGAFLGARIAKTKLSYYSDSVVPTLPLAHAIGRIGCFCAGCCYGKVTDSWIGMVFPYSDLPTSKVIPTQLIECGANLLVFAFLVWFTLRRRKGFITLYVYLIIYGVERFLIEYLRGDEIRGIFGALSTSQWISIGLIVAAVVGIVLTKRFVREPEGLSAAGPEADASAEGAPQDAPEAESEVSSEKPAESAEPADPAEKEPEESSAKESEEDRA